MLPTERQATTLMQMLVSMELLRQHDAFLTDRNLDLYLQEYSIRRSSNRSITMEEATTAFQAIWRAEWKLRQPMRPSVAGLGKHAAICCREFVRQWLTNQFR